MVATSPSTEASPSVDGPPTTEVSPSTEASPSVDGPPTTEVSPSTEASPSVDVPKATEASPSVDGPKTTEVSPSVYGRRDYCDDFLCCICFRPTRHFSYKPIPPPTLMSSITITTVVSATALSVAEIRHVGVRIYIRDQVFKPLVLACGHIGCFWCVLNSMKTSDSSECPICRQPYRHFPRVCGLLHRVLLKVIPEVYKKREREELDKEGEKAAFSQQMPDDMIVQSDYSVENPVKVHEHYKLSEEDLLCSECKKMLVKPVVRNCGHVYCQSCLKLECKICQYPHVGQAPKVCLILDSLIQDHFPALYRIRHLKRQLDDIDYQENADLSTEAFQSVLKYSPWSYHSGVGCDVCGMFPIAGKRYSCKDCRGSTTGYDLCEGCYGSNLHLPGRFNQNHNPEHTFIIDGSMLFR